jgi:DNA invertase Pin-like site-specific DNA recombinase
MVYGYARVSTDKQDIERQRLELLDYANRYGLGSVKLTIETISSRKQDREVYTMLDSLKAGDHVLVGELSRLARNMIELNGIICRIVQSGASLHVVSGALSGKPIDDSIQAQAMIFAIGMAGQIERDMISERTKSGLAARKAQGVKLGRPSGVSKLDSQAADIDKYLKLNVDKANIARIIGCSRGTLYAWLKARGKA